MAYQSKTYSLSEEVIAAIDAARLAGETPNQFLRRVIAAEKPTAIAPVARKENKRARAIRERANGDVPARKAEREDINYEDIESEPSSPVATLDAQPKTQGRPKLKKSMEQ